MSLKCIERYKPLVKFLAEVLGKNCEIVLHDLEDFENSVIAIENGQISGRKVGDSLTDLALNVLKDQEKLENGYLTNYTGKTFAGKNLNHLPILLKKIKKLWVCFV